MRYDHVYERRAKRAVAEGMIDLSTFIEDMRASGAATARIEEMLIADLRDGGPLFGKFLRSLSAAAESSVLAAERQGDTVGYIASRKELRDLVGTLDLDDVLDAADPELLEMAEGTVAVRIEYTWIAALENTCDLCLPLHGTALTLAEWRELGYHPDTIHPGSWRSSCHCQLVPSDQAEGRDDLIEPLVRVKVPGAKGVRRTVRAVAQKDPGRAIAAVATARRSKTGRQVLRAMGRSGAVDE